MIILSSVSYLAAAEVALKATGQEYFIDTRGYLAASLVGAVIVLTGARLIIPLRRSGPLAVAGLLAAIIGGLVFVPADYSCRSLAYMTWHSLIAIAIHFSQIQPRHSDNTG